MVSCVGVSGSMPVSVILAVRMFMSVVWPVIVAGMVSMVVGMISLMNVRMLVIVVMGIDAIFVPITITVILRVSLAIRM